MHVPTRTIVSAVGTRPQPILDGLDLPRDERGRIVTDRYLRVEGHENVWAGGDCASVPHPHGGTCPPVGLYALKHGARIGENVQRRLDAAPARAVHVLGVRRRHLDRRPHRRRRGARRPAAREARWILWRAILVYYLPTWDRRLRLLADWLIWPVVGRDVVELDHAPRSEFDVRHQAFEPGEVLARAARPVRMST